MHAGGRAAQDGEQAKIPLMKYDVGTRYDEADFCRQRRGYGGAQASKPPHGHSQHGTLLMRAYETSVFHGVAHIQGARTDPRRDYEGGQAIRFMREEEETHQRASGGGHRRDDGGN